MTHGKSQLSDNQRRLVCRIVFLLLCVLPTSAAIYFIFHQSGPGDWENLIQAKLGIRVEINSVETPFPNQTVLRGVRVSGSEFDLPTENEDLRFEEIVIETGIRERSADKKIIELNQVLFPDPVDIATDSLAAVLRRCSEQLELSDFGNMRWQAGFRKITLTDSDNGSGESHETNRWGFVLKQATISLERTVATQSGESGSIRARLLTHVPAHDFGTNEAQQGLDNIVEFEFQKTNAYESFRVNTFDSAIPCRLFRHWYKNCEWLQSNSKFQGTAELRVGADAKVDGIIEGAVKEIALDRLGATLDSQLTGSVGLTGIQCRINRSQITSLQMHVSSNGPGKIGAELLAACKNLGVESIEIGLAKFMKYGSLDFDLSILGRTIAISSPNSYIVVDTKQRPLARCSGEERPVAVLAMLFTGEVSYGELSQDFVDLFTRQERYATNPGSVNTVKR